MPEDRSTHVPDDDPLATAIAAVVLALLAVVFLVRGLPWPETDDPAFVGTAIELARSGRLTNPWIAEFLADLGMRHFYIQPPLHAYSLAGWVHYFGVGTVSFRIFAWTWYILGGVGLLSLLRRFGLPVAAGLLLVGLYVATMADTGLRPEGEAGALLFLGLALLDWSARLSQKVLALTLLGLSPLAYPLSLGLAVPLVLARWEQARPPGTPPGRWLVESARAWGMALAVALPLVIMAFLAMIRFDLGGFLAGYRAHFQYRHSYLAGDGGSWHYFLVITLGGAGKALTLPVLVLFTAALVFVLWRWRHIPPGARALVLGCAGAAVACEVLYVVTAGPWTVWLAFCALAALAGTLRSRPGRRVALVGVALLATWHNALGIMDLAERRFPAPAVFQAAAKAARASPKGLMMDASTLRYVFNYRVPADTRDVSFAKPLTALPPERIWVVCPARYAPKCSLAVPDPGNFPRESLGLHTFRSQPLYPDQPAVIQ